MISPSHLLELPFEQFYKVSFYDAISQGVDPITREMSYAELVEFLNERREQNVLIGQIQFKHDLGCYRWLSVDGCKPIKSKGRAILTAGAKWFLRQFIEDATLHSEFGSGRVEVQSIPSQSTRTGTSNDEVSHYKYKADRVLREVIGRDFETMGLTSQGPSRTRFDEASTQYVPTYTYHLQISVCLIRPVS